MPRCTGHDPQENQCEFQFGHDGSCSPYRKSQCSCRQPHGDEIPEGRLLVVQVVADGIWFCWVLHDDNKVESDWRGRELARSRRYGSLLAAEDAAREVLGGWLGPVLGIDLERHDGTRERLR